MKIKHTIATVTLTALSLSANADLARVGPANLPSPPGHGFPKWYQDLNGAVLDLCLPNASDSGALQQNACLLVGPGLPDPPYSFPDNFPDEAFYFNASSLLDMPSGKRATLVLALEAAFSVGAVVQGDQVVFTRIRVFAGVPEAGTYTVTHPYGVDTFPVDAVSASGNRDIVFSEDVGVARGDFNGALKSRVGPFLQRADRFGAPAGPVTLNGAQFLSDGVATEFVTGSPFGTNYFEICGVRADGTDIILGDQGASGTCIRSDQFSLMGRLHDFVANPIPSPLDIYSSFYKRDTTGTQVDVYARNTKLLPSQPDPSLTAAAANMAPVMMVPFGATALGEFYSQGLVDPLGALPGPVSVINSSDNPPSIFTKHAVDVVTAASANYSGQTLTVIATSSDKGFGDDQPPTLTLEGYSATAASTNNANDPAEMILTATNVPTPPDTVTVKSTAGGSGTFPVARPQIIIGGGTVSAPGVPLALDDAAAAEAGGAAVDIPVTANDVANPAAPITSVQLIGAAIPAGSGSAAVNGSVITYTPGSANGDVTFQYTATNSVGQSNAATVVVTVSPSAAGPAPIVNPDGPVNVAVNQSTVIDVLSNDSGNGGTLSPASVLVSNVTGTAVAPTVNAAGKVTYTAGATAGTFGFDYTVANDNGQVSPLAHVTVTVVNPEDIQITASQCKPISTTSGEWRVAGTSTVQTNNSIQLYLTASVPADLNTNKLGAAVPVVAGVPNGTWELRLKPGPACKTPISLRSSATGATRANIAVSAR